MTEKEISNDLTQFGRDIGDFSDDLRTVMQLRDELQRNLSGLSQMWSGQASREFQKRIAEKMKETNDLIAELDSLKGLMENARDHYTDCENEVGAVIDRISV